MKLVKKILIGTALLAIISVLALFLFLKYYTPPLSFNTGKVNAQLYISDAENQPLIVAFGGSQGGNTWTEDYWGEMRTKFIGQGYAVLSIGYFNTEGTPKTLDRISLDAINDTIKKFSHHPKVDSNKIILLGTSRGGELVLNLASRHNSFAAVVALVPPHVTFPAGSITANTSAWTHHEKELNFVPIPFSATIAFITGNNKKAWELILARGKSMPEAEIEVEKIGCPILLLSASDDEAWPSQYMCEQLVNRLRNNDYQHHYEHVSFDGGHHIVRDHFFTVFEFLENHIR